MKEPDRIARLPHDKRGYPIPWNAARTDEGFPFFIINDDRKHYRALRDNLCSICGEILGRWKWFVGGPRSAFDPAGCYLDLPGHRECMRFALTVCPYLASPRYLRHLEHIPHADKLPPKMKILVDETMIPERPEVFVAVAASRVEVAHTLLLPRVRPIRPYLAHEFWLHGREISHAEALPTLRGIFGEDWTLPSCAEG